MDLFGIFWPIVASILTLSVQQCFTATVQYHVCSFFGRTVWSWVKAVITTVGNFVMDVFGFRNVAEGLPYVMLVSETKSYLGELSYPVACLICLNLMFLAVIVGLFVVWRREKSRNKQVTNEAFPFSGGSRRESGVKDASCSRSGGGKATAPGRRTARGAAKRPASEPLKEEKGVGHAPYPTDPEAWRQETIWFPLVPNRTEENKASSGGTPAGGQSQRAAPAAAVEDLAANGVGYGKVPRMDKVEELVCGKCGSNVLISRRVSDTGASNIRGAAEGKIPPPATRGPEAAPEDAAGSSEGEPANATEPANSAAPALAPLVSAEPTAAAVGRVPSAAVPIPPRKEQSQTDNTDGNGQEDLNGRVKISLAPVKTRRRMAASIGGQDSSDDDGDKPEQGNTEEGAVKDPFAAVEGFQKFVKLMKQREEDPGEGTSAGVKASTPVGKKGGKAIAKTKHTQETDDSDDEETAPLPRKEVRHIRQDYARKEREQFMGWLNRCWDGGMDTVEINPRTVRQLGVFSRDNGIDKHLGHLGGNSNLWSRVLTAVVLRYPNRDDLPWRPSRWNTVEQGVQCLREMAIRELIYGDYATEDPDKVPMSHALLKKLIQLAPSNYAHTLASKMVGRDDERNPLTVGEFADQMRQMEDSLTYNAMVSAINTMAEDIKDGMKQLKEEFKTSISQLAKGSDLSSSPSEWVHVSAIRDRRPPRRPIQTNLLRNRQQSRGSLWVILRDQFGENMNKWDGKPTSLLLKRVRELQNDKIKRVVASVSPNDSGNDSNNTNKHCANCTCNGQH